MWRVRKGQVAGWVLILLLVFGLAACTNGEAAEAGEAEAPAGGADGDSMDDDMGGDMAGDVSDEEGEHNEEEEMAGEHAEAGHDIPEEAAELANPVEATETSVEAGEALFAANCAVCHGVEGRGDGPTAETLDPPPADLHADHVQVLADGELFWVITHGVEGTGMPPWEDVLTEEERWHVVNFIRTFEE